MTAKPRAQKRAPNTEAKVTVRTTLRPTEPIEVTEAERRDLEAQGLLAAPEKGN